MDSFLNRAEIEISEEPITELTEYACLPIAFEVSSVFDVEAGERGEILLPERRIAEPYIKDYDAIAGEGPGSWKHHFDLSRWGMLAARSDGRLVGGAVIAFATEGVRMLEGRSDLAVLWDIRVAPELRGRGIGSMLFAAAESWAAERHCVELKVETQNINVAACRFYARHGCELRVADRSAYPGLPEEIQLLWYKKLGATRSER